ncbi:MAG: glycosyltransferase family 2 protein [Patescibacteria group bacterium]
MHISINIVSWNDRRYLPEVFAAIRSQTHKDFSVRILDNGNPDGEALQYIMQNEPHWLAVRNTKNVGFACGQNQLARLAMERYTGDPASHAILIASSETDWNPTMLEELVKVLEEHAEIDAVQPKIFRAYSERGDVESDAVKSDILDSTGMIVRKGWRTADRGAGEMDMGQFDEKADIVGPAGTLFLVRAIALRDVMIEDEVFDGEFFSYREDADFALRFRRAGHKTYFAPAARAHHYRGMFGTEQQSLIQRFRNRKMRRPSVAALATRNQLWTLFKNLTVGEWFRSAPWIFLYDGSRVAYGVLAEPETRRALLRMPLALPLMFRKRGAVKAIARVSIQELRRYIS